MAATLQIIKSKNNSYKIISNSRRKHPALIQLATLLLDSNRYSDIKCGCFNVFGGEFESHKTVYSYISNKTERMSKSQYYKWLSGQRQINGNHKTEVKQWNSEESQAELNAVIEDICK
jgi:hypothetical protein